MKRLTNILIIVVLGLLIIGCTSTPTTPQDTSTNTELIPTTAPVETTAPTESVETTPTLIPSLTESPTEALEIVATATPSPIPTSTPTPTVSPTPSPIPTDSSLYEYEIQRGENVWFRFTEDTLYVTGTGRIDEWKDYGRHDRDIELRDRLDAIKTIVIEEGITEVGKYALGDACHAEELILPQTLTRIESCAFVCCGLINTFYDIKLTVIGLDKNRITIEEKAFWYSSLDDDELTFIPTPTPTPTPIVIPLPNQDDVDPNNPKIIARAQMGDNVWFEFYDTYELHVVGSGRMWDRNYTYVWSWDPNHPLQHYNPKFDREYLSNMKACYIAKEITYIGLETFLGMSFDEVYCYYGFSLHQYAYGPSAESATYINVDGKIAKVRHTSDTPTCPRTAQDAIRIYMLSEEDRTDDEKYMLQNFIIEWQ